VSTVEVAILDANRPPRAFRRITGAALARLLPEHNGSESESDSAE
jgi:proteasome alpha subunit